MNATLQNVEITERNSALAAFAQRIDFSELFEHAAALANVDCSFEQPRITANRSGELFVRVESGDITAQTGAFAAILKSCVICNFGGGIVNDRETGEPKCWLPLSMSYTHKDGGSNGMSLLTAWYSESGGWTFRDVE
jgi:hypothetical protein